MPEKTSFGARLMNGGIAGVVGTSCIFPLDLAKTRLQDQNKVIRAGKSPALVYRNVFDVALKVSRAEGIRGLYRGLAVNLALVMPEKALKLAVNDQTRYFLGSGRGPILPLHYEMFAGALAGFCQVVITTPMEFLKIQMQVATVNAAQSTGGSKATSAFSLASSLIKKDGLRGVYRGLLSTLCRDVNFSMIYFPLFAYMNGKGYGPNLERPNPLHSFTSGILAGIPSAFAVTPFDVIKTRLQVLNRPAGEIPYRGILDCAGRILKEEGVAAFFKGAVPRMVVIAPLFGIAQMVYFLGVAERLLGYQ